MEEKEGKKREEKGKLEREGIKGGTGGKKGREGKEERRKGVGSGRPHLSEHALRTLRTWTQVRLQPVGAVCISCVSKS